ncbi:sugar ABC transporter ATP-binding protein [Labrys wisconsinensis]|uniref:ABC-type sugar transport system ATPase subunit n=1 Tax=Labrys wisconsinensis TaxID=425677 RepID=A0ABU0JC65_9HYPH|nr:sugar ABC transporter ATP-binding protein [Labrys wisconsinensis]MDQ0471881.1 ABC-type sugar transport system ATPase subunit [Labrys wisconsinensis]
MSARGTLAVVGASKWYGATKALTDVSLDIPAGEVVALVGHNGAGKSTLLRLLSGAETPNAGSISINGRPVIFASPAEAGMAGIACVYQELSLIGELTVAENLFLGVEKENGPLLDRRAMNRAADALCLEYGIPATAGDPVAGLSVAHRQLLEVARAIHRDARFLLLDEPTTALEQKQIDELLVVIRRLARERGIGILFIDHKLDEVFAVADRIVGLSNGQVVLSGDADRIGREDVVEAIVGAGQDGMPSAGQGHRHSRGAGLGGKDAGDVVFEARGLAGNGLQGVSLKVRAGEVLGIYGLIGSGRSRFLRTVYGVEAAPEGTMVLGGKAFAPADPERAIAAGVAFLSEERKSDGFIPQMTSIDNVLMPVLERYLSAGLLNWSALRKAAAAALGRVPIRGDVSQPITALSGGNQQKVLFARALLQAPRLLLLDEPTKGVDIGAKAEIYEIIADFARSGGSVLVVSSEEEELLDVADRVVVFRKGACDGVAIPEAELSVAALRRHAWSQAA